MPKVAIVGCGVVGAAIAYELSQCSPFEITVIDQNTPASGSTGAALGVAMAVISHKVKGRNWRLREQSLRRYRTLLSELEASTGQTIQHTQGILSLCFDEAELPRWQSLQAIRQGQGYTLELWSPEQVAERCPYLAVDNVAVGIYSPDDIQVNPAQLTNALVTAAKTRGVTFFLGESVQGFDSVVPASPGLSNLLKTQAPKPQSPDASDSNDSTAPPQRCMQVNTASRQLDTDWVVLAAGLGTTALTQGLQQPLALGPVLGQGLKLHLDTPLSEEDFQPVINGSDIHLVPLGGGDYWVGATVEFPPETDPAQVTLIPEAERLEAVLQGAIAYCPALAQATIIDRWFGLRPRPQGQAAPVIQPLAGYSNVMLATGHYRNGVLLAPATALAVRDYLLAQIAQV